MARVRRRGGQRPRAAVTERNAPGGRGAMASAAVPKRPRTNAGAGRQAGAQKDVDGALAALALAAMTTQADDPPAKRFAAAGSQHPKPVPPPLSPAAAAVLALTKHRYSGAAAKAAESDASPMKSAKSASWTPLEENRLVKLVEHVGQKHWSVIAASMPGRSGKQCRERWLNHLRPDIRRGSWSEEEELVLAKGHLELGTRWSALAQRLPGRTENSIKNRWNATLRCKGRARTAAETDSAAPAAGTLLKRYVEAWSTGGAKAAARVVALEQSRLAKASQSVATTLLASARDTIDQCEEGDPSSPTGTEAENKENDEEMDGDGGEKADEECDAVAREPSVPTAAAAIAAVAAIAASVPAAPCRLAAPITYNLASGDVISIEPGAPDASVHLNEVARASGPGSSTMVLSSGSGGPGVAPAHAHIAAEQGIALCSTMRLRWPSIRICRIVARAGPPKTEADPAILLVVSASNWRVSAECLAFAAEALSFQSPPPVSEKAAS